MRLAIGSDHAAFREKQILIKYLNKLDLKVLDFGTDSEDSVDYPIFGQKVAKSIINNIADRGIIICGSGIGISIAANRFKVLEQLYVLLNFMLKCQESITIRMF